MNIKLNKNDVILIICILFISLFFILILNSKSKKDNIAKVYYDNKLIKQINLNKNNTYEVKGYNGTVKLEVKNNKIRVIEEKSPLHLCSKYGYISNEKPNLDRDENANIKFIILLAILMLGVIILLPFISNLI